MSNQAMAVAIAAWALPLWVRVVLGAAPAPQNVPDGDVSAVAERSNLFPPPSQEREHVGWILCGGVLPLPEPPVCVGGTEMSPSESQALLAAAEAALAEGDVAAAMAETELVRMRDCPTYAAHRALAARVEIAAVLGLARHAPAKELKERLDQARRLDPGAVPEDAVFTVARALRLEGHVRGALSLLRDNREIGPRVARTWRRAAIEETDLVLDRDGRREADRFVDELTWPRDPNARRLGRELHRRIAWAEHARVVRWTAPPAGAGLACLVWLWRERRRRGRDLGRIRREVEAGYFRLGVYR